MNTDPSAPEIATHERSPSAYARYALITPFRLPYRLRYRHGVILVLEIARDCSTADLPTWVFRARKLGSYLPPANPAGRCPVPTVNLHALTAPQPDCLNLVSSFYGRKHLEHALREGWTLPIASPHARVMDALVALGRAMRSPG